MFVANSIALNQAAAAMWKWEQTGRTDKSLWEEARGHVARYCEKHGIPGLTGMLHDTIQITVRIANGFPPKGHRYG